MGVDIEIAFATFVKRYRENIKNKSFDNSQLPAGSPMHYFCHGCYIKVATLPEGWFSSGPPKYCDACKSLAEHGLLSEAQKYLEEQRLMLMQPMTQNVEEIKAILDSDAPLKNELTQEQFVERLVQAGWKRDEAEEEARRNFEGEYDE